MKVTSMVSLIYRDSFTKDLDLTLSNDISLGYAKLIAMSCSLSLIRVTFHEIIVLFPASSSSLGFTRIFIVLSSIKLEFLTF